MTTPPYFEGEQARRHTEVILRFSRHGIGSEYGVGEYVTACEFFIGDEGFAHVDLLKAEIELCEIVKVIRKKHFANLLKGATNGGA